MRDVSIIRTEEIRRLPVVQGERFICIVARVELAAVTPAAELSDTARQVSQPAARRAERRAERGEARRRRCSD